MKLFLERTVIKKELSEVRCNACGKGVGKDASGYLLDHVEVSKRWGYHSPFDGESHTIDLCIPCYQIWISQFKIPPAAEPPYAEERFAYA
jgi:hypothetical protein